MEWQVLRTSSVPLYQQLVTAIKQKIMTGELIPGDRLPSERHLSEQLQVNRSTIIRAYDELAAEGIVTKKRGSGTLVSHEFDVKSRYVMNWRRFLKADEEETSPSYLYKKALQHQLTCYEETIIDGYTGELPQTMIPPFNLKEMKWHDFLQAGVETEAFGIASLRHMLVEFIDQQLDYQMNVNELLLTAGGQQSLFFIINALLKTGDIVAIESPSYFYSLPMFENLGIKTIGIPMEEDGINLSYLEKMIKNNAIKMLFVTPSFQNPTTISMSLERKKALIALCEKYQVIIVEDDVYGLLSYKTNKESLLKKLSSENVIYVGSLTKVLGKTIQLGWVNAPQRVLDALVKIREDWEQPLSVFPQMLVSQLMMSADFPVLVDQLRQNLYQKVTFLHRLIQSELGTMFRCEMPKGGYYLWLTYEGERLNVNDWEFLLKEKILVFPSFLLTDNAQSIRINAANLRTNEMVYLVHVLKNRLTKK
ncbi:PLP-dependent aminotransferase family protein [Vagococcus xieshaowenii]|uniref:PLP-dependent aminotransferase family protein n=1 Tax=Vagococcus xieshaowenii TaxID=2562451 RepID=A0AAJ5EEU1_9ENTE|nr:PLP-dependent aminotransferase family protein [Vagococcus xieshaowenii]QCA28327.1 PLP-dependent aminotransferase family protein [Vagococcus xieshaowenii]TFZ42286.1 PLP-dependent aminotransferase family protein [Vagococcus xieshaowenii]